MLKMNQADIMYLSAYLHDALLLASDIHLPQDDSVLRITLVRQCFEEPRRGRWLLVIPAIRYPAVDCELRVHDVESVDVKWANKGTSRDGFIHTVLEISLEENRFIFVTDGVTLTATLISFRPIELEDISSPTEKSKFMDLFTSVSRFDEWKHEIDKLRADV